MGQEGGTLGIRHTHTTLGSSAKSVIELPLQLIGLCLDDSGKCSVFQSSALPQAPCQGSVGIFGGVWLLGWDCPPALALTSLSVHLTWERGTTWFCHLSRVWA